MPLISADLAKFKNTSLDKFIFLFNLFLRLLKIQRLVIKVLELVFFSLFSINSAFHRVKSNKFVFFEIIFKMNLFCSNFFALLRFFLFLIFKYFTSFYFSVSQTDKNLKFLYSCVSSIISLTTLFFISL